MRAKAVASFPVHDGCVEDGTRHEHEVASEHLFQGTGRRRNRPQEDQVAPVGGQAEARGAAHIEVTRIARRVERIPLSLSRSRTRNATQNNGQQQESAKTIVAPHVGLLEHRANGQQNTRRPKLRRRQCRGSAARRSRWASASRFPTAASGDATFSRAATRQDTP